MSVAARLLTQSPSHSLTNHITNVTSHNYANRFGCLCNQTVDQNLVAFPGRE